MDPRVSDLSRESLFEYRPETSIGNRVMIITKKDDKVIHKESKSCLVKSSASF